MSPLLRAVGSILFAACHLLTMQPAFADELQPLPSASGKEDEGLHGTKKLLIIAPEQFQKSLKDYAEHKRSQLPVQLESLETILRNSEGSDEPEKLKRHLYSAWRDDNVGYVLLVGDADVMPVRYMVLDRVTPAAFDYAFYPSDLYYSDLAKADGSFDSWNAQMDDFHAGYFGEVRGEKNKSGPMNFDHVDYRPDIAVGRWPVSTPSEVRTVAEKTIRYERSLRDRIKANPRRAAFFSVSGWVDSRPAMDASAAALGSTGWATEKRYYTDKRRNDGTPAPDLRQLSTILGEGAGIVFHAGHGTDNTWEQCFSRQDIAGLNNADRLPILMSIGCSTARISTLPPYEPYTDVTGNDHRGTDAGEVFSEPPPPPAPYQKGRHNPSGLGEALLRDGPNGAVAYIGCNTGSQPCGLRLQEGFTTALAERARAEHSQRLGDCWAQAIRHYYEKEHLETLTPTESWYPASIFFQGMKFMLFGDPSLLLP
ncbi:C25 family cysteine peptidase [Verrucomicrobiota bacterium sgz303538]